MYFDFFSILSDLGSKFLVRLRGVLFGLLFGIHFKKLGRNVKIRGSRFFQAGNGVCVGDYCWLEAVYRYQSVRYTPSLIIGNEVAFSDFCHISCAHKITIGDNCLFGSKVYVGDHSHGSLNKDKLNLNIPPKSRPLDDFGEINIGKNCWIGDGVVLLAGTSLAAGSIVGANSVVKTVVTRPALVAGVPAKIIRYL